MTNRERNAACEMKDDFMKLAAIDIGVKVAEDCISTGLFDAFENMRKVIINNCPNVPPAAAGQARKALDSLTESFMWAMHSRATFYAERKRDRVEPEKSDGTVQDDM